MPQNHRAFFRLNSPAHFLNVLLSEEQFGSLAPPRLKLDHRHDQ
jgi:hypothetical protein